ncbi:WD40 repeat domain-containing protein [Gordonia sp. NPDC062954]|uniref:WD40 repeat domain-containing protein n=1 Tax=Gordonia sp. NPDC062954 TaxID=3364003 RepID=UPI0037CBDF7B
MVDEALTRSVPEHQLREFASSRGEIIPVSRSRTDAVNYLSDLSHAIFDNSSVPDMATEIAAIATVGGRRITEWNRIVIRAREWRENPATAPLMDEADTQSAELIVADPPRLFAANDVESVRLFVAASESAISRRRRRAVGVLSAVAVALVALIGLASCQAVNANNSRVEAREAQATAEADRLADLSIRTASADPDLPLVLLNEALDIKVTDRVRAAVNTVEAGTWPHRSLRLPAAPVEVSAAQNASRVAVLTSTPPTVHVYNTADGTVVAQRQLPPAEQDQGVAFALSADGARVALQYEGDSIQVFDVSGGQLTSVPKSQGELLGWLDSRNLAVATSGGLGSLDHSDGGMTPVVTVAAGDLPVRGFARTPDGSVTAVLAHDVLYLSGPDVATNKHPVSGGMDVSVSADGKTAAVAGYPESYIVRTDQARDEPSPIAVNATHVNLVAGSVFAFGTREGRLVQTNSSTVLRSVVAHLDLGTKASRDGSGRLVSIGYDGYMRIWTPDPNNHGGGEPVMFGRLHDMADAVFARQSNSSLLESTRNQIRMRPGSTFATVIAQPNYVWTVDVDTHKATDDRPTYFGGLDADSALSPSGTAAARVVSKGAGTATVSDKNGRLISEAGIDGTSLQMAIAGMGEGLLAVDDDASTVVTADPTHLYCWSTTQLGPNLYNRTFDAGRGPVALSAQKVDGTSRCRALTADGYLRDEKGDEHKLTIPGLTQRLEAGDTRFAAGTFTDGQRTVIAVTSDGEIYRITGKTGDRIGTVGPGLETIAVRISPSGKIVVVIGQKATVFVDTESGDTIDRDVAQGTSFISDVAFTDTEERNVVAVTSLSAIMPLSVDGGCGQELCAMPAPRELTEFERSDYARPINANK